MNAIPEPRLYVLITSAESVWRLSFCNTRVPSAPMAYIAPNLATSAARKTMRLAARTAIRAATMDTARNLNGLAARDKMGLVRMVIRAAKMGTARNRATLVAKEKRGLV